MTNNNRGLLFVYGTLKRGHCRAHCLEGQEFVGTVRTESRHRLFDCGRYPGLVTPRNRGYPIIGEVFRIAPSLVPALDDEEGVAQGLYAHGSVRLPQNRTAFTYLYLGETSHLVECGPVWPVAKPGVWRRYAILLHDHPTPHRDLLLETAADRLTTWRLPVEHQIGRQLSAQALPDHRRKYLDYEGPVSGDRGEVQQLDGGYYRVRDASPDGWIIELYGHSFCGSLSFERERRPDVASTSGETNGLYGGDGTICFSDDPPSRLNLSDPPAAR